MNDKHEAFCAGREETVHRFLDGDLTSLEREEFLSHLYTCQSCETLLAELKNLFNELGTLEAVAPPEEIVFQVMSNLPPAYTSPRFVTIDQLALAGQVIIGLVLIGLAWPAIAVNLNNQFGWQTWHALSYQAASLNHWLIEPLTYLNTQLWTAWTPGVGLNGPNLSSSVGFVLVVALSLAWLIGNSLLLRHQPTSLKNGGTL